MGHGNTIGTALNANPETRKPKHLVLDQSISELEFLNDRLIGLLARLRPPEPEPDCRDNELKRTAYESSFSEVLDNGPSRILTFQECANRLISEIEEILF